ncbi:MAG: DUF413 domain-containing protein [Aeromonadaceae bacterium]
MSFESDKRFNDFQHFPRGLRRSGEFTVAEANTLEQCGHVMLELYQGKREPKDEVETDFVARVKSGEAAGNTFAKVWFKYLKVIGPRRVHRLCTSGGNATDDGPFEAAEESLD